MRPHPIRLAFAAWLPRGAGTALAQAMPTPLRPRGPTPAGQAGHTAPT
jgi:hypothetical protein